MNIYLDDDDGGGLSNIQIEFTMDDSEHEGEGQEGTQRGTRGRRYPAGRV